MTKGRPVGSNSIVLISVKELIALCPDGNVAVSKKFLDGLGADTKELKTLKTRDIAKINGTNLRKTN